MASSVVTSVVASIAAVSVSVSVSFWAIVSLTTESVASLAAATIILAPSLSELGVPATLAAKPTPIPNTSTAVAIVTFLIHF